MEITTKALTEIEAAIKEGTPDGLGKALLRSFALGRIEMQTNPKEPVMPPLYDMIYESAYNNFADNEEKRVLFSRFVNIEDWIKRNRYFALAQLGATQRDLLMLQSYADKFLLTEKIKLGDFTEDTLAVLNEYGVESIINPKPCNEPITVTQIVDISNRLSYSSAWLIAFNTIIDIMSEVFSIPEYTITKISLEDCADDLSKVNDTFKMTASLINANDNYSDDEKFEKINIINTFNSFADNDGLSKKPSASALAKASKEITDLTAFDDTSRIFYILLPEINNVLKLEK